jgi:hypothetical protein
LRVDRIGRAGFASGAADSIASRVAPAILAGSRQRENAERGDRDRPRRNQDGSYIQAENQTFRDEIAAAQAEGAEPVDPAAVAMAKGNEGGRKMLDRLTKNS